MPTIQPYSATAQVKSLAGTAALPGITFTGDTDTGFYSPAANQVAITTGGVQRLLIGSDGSITPSGSLLFPAGTAAAPSLSFTGDTDTGIYSPFANSVAISTGGSGRLFVDASGNVGVATGAPSYRLEVNGTISQSSQGTSSALIQAVNAGGIFYHGLDNSAGTTFGHAYAAALWHSGAYPILFATNGTERLRITSAGLVGVGTSSPSHKLDVQGGVISAGNGTIYGGIGYSTRPEIGAISNHDCGFITNNTTRMLLDTAGRLGIGTASPSQLLTLQQTSAGAAIDCLFLNNSSVNANTSVGISFGPNVSNTVDRSAVIRGINESNGSGNATGLQFLTNANGASPTEKARIDSSGRLLVGTSSARSNFYNSSSYSPRLQLESANDGASSSIALISVSGGGFDEPNLVFAKSRGSAIGNNTIVASGDDIGNISFQASDGSEFVVAANILAEVDGTPGANDMPGRLVFATTADGASSPTERLRITSAGLVGVGTSSPGFPFQVKSTTNAHVAIWDNGGIPQVLGVNDAGGSAQLRLAGQILSFTGSGGAGSEHMRLDASGRLGIGTSSPINSLEVVGGATSNLFAVKASSSGDCLSITARSAGNGAVISALNGAQSDYEPFELNGEFIYFQTRTGTGTVSERLRITSAGLVGIGTSSPASLLSVVKAAEGTSLEALRLVNESPNQRNTSSVYIGMYGSNEAYERARILCGNPTDFDGNNGFLSFWTRNAGTLAEKVRIDNAGRLGIGTTSPARTLDVNGSIQLPSNNALYINGSNNYLYADSTATELASATLIKFVANGSERLRITSAGLVGIGTSSPDANSQLHIVGSSYQPLYVNTTGVGGGGATFFRSGTQALYVGTAGSSWLSGSSIADGLVRAEANLVLSTNGNSRAVTIDTSQRVGIGATSPLTKLDVRSGVITAGSNSSPNGTEILRGYYSDTDGALAVIGTEYSSGGTVIGSAVKPSTSVSGAFLSSTTINISRGAYTIAGNTHKWYIGAAQTVVENSSVATSEVMCINSSGNVGIGTASPADAQLYVNSSAIYGVRINHATLPLQSFLVNGTQAFAIGANSGGGGSFYYGTGNVEAARIDSSGRLLVGTSSSSAEAKFIVQGGATAAGGAINIQRNATTASAGSTIGFINFTNSANNVGATISADGDGTWSAGTSHPTLLVFSTTANGASSPTERLRITSAGLVGIGTSSPSGLLHVAGQIYSSGTGYAGTNSPTVRLINSTATTGRTFGINSTDSGSFQVFDASAGDATRLWLDSSGRVGIGTLSPGALLHAAGKIRFGSNAGYYGEIDHDAGSTGANIYDHSDTGGHIFRNGGQEALRIDGSKRLLVGTSTARLYTSLGYARFQVEGTAFADSSIGLTNNQATVDGSYLVFNKTRGTSVGSVTSVQSGDLLGSIWFQGSDGTSQVRGAVIEAVVDATPGASDMPSRLVFSTTADGASSPTERMRIAANGQMTHSLNGTTNAANLTLNVGGVGDPGNTGWITPRIDFVGSSLASSGTTFIGATGGFGGRSLVFATGSDGAGTERARIDSSGRLLVGTSTGSYKFQINALGSTGFVFDDANGAISNTFGTGGNLTLRAQVASSSGGGEIYLGGSTRGDSNINSIVLSTANTERMRIGQNGYIQCSETGTYSPDGGSVWHKFYQSVNERCLQTYNTAGTFTNYALTQYIAAGGGTGSGFASGFSDSGSIQRYIIFSNGNIQNTNNSYGAISDLKLKENIVDASEQWNDIKNLRVRKYNLKQGGAHTQIGVIAQEIELVSPGLVYETTDRDTDGNDLGTVTKSVNYSVLYMKAVKALQEAMERIETLEAKVAALEA